MTPQVIAKAGTPPRRVRARLERPTDDGAAARRAADLARHWRRFGAASFNILSARTRILKDRSEVDCDIGIRLHREGVPGAKDRRLRRAGRHVALEQLVADFQRPILADVGFRVAMATLLVVAIQGRLKDLDNGGRDSRLRLPERKLLMRVATPVRFLVRSLEPNRSIVFPSRFPSVSLSRSPYATLLRPRRDNGLKLRNSSLRDLQASYCGMAAPGANRATCSPIRRSF